MIQTIISLRFPIDSIEICCRVLHMEVLNGTGRVLKKSHAKALLGGNLRNDESERRLLNLPSKLGKSSVLRSETESALS
ncbi:hypothetical protein [Bradyrhizobium shewense]|uniref:hypothetical protein n=1 Tax=Bradyrhizobium shewense TaxID=1761772 RepID=UPI00101AED1A|nr:hypothetical protein [Bradyrhizobium shewense]